MPDITALASLARNFSTTVERKIIHDLKFRTAAFPRLKAHWEDRVLSGLGATEAGMDLAGGLSVAPPTPVVTFMRAGIYANLMQRFAQDSAGLIPKEMRTEENFRAVDALDGSFARLLKP